MENKNVEEKKEREFAAGVEITVTSVEVLEDTHKVQQVKKVTMKTNQGDITYKPKVKKEEFRDGFKVITSEPAYFKDLCNVLKEMANECTTNGKVVVKAHYHIWNTQVDGVDTTYRYVQGLKMMEKWEVVKEVVVEEPVVM